MSGADDLSPVTSALRELERAVRALRTSHGDTLGMRRLLTDVRRIGEDLAELGPPAAQPPTAPGLRRTAPGPHWREPGERLQTVPDDDSGGSPWPDVDDEGVGGWHGHPLASRPEDR